MVLVGEMIDGDGFGMDDVVDGDAIVFFLDAKEFLFCRFATRACFRFSLRLLRFGILTHDWFQEICNKLEGGVNFMSEKSFLDPLKHTSQKYNT